MYGTYSEFLESKTERNQTAKMGNDHDHGLGSTYFKLFGKGMSRAPDLHLGQAYGHTKKT